LEKAIHIAELQSCELDVQSINVACQRLASDAHRPSRFVAVFVRLENRGAIDASATCHDRAEIDLHERKTNSH
jgi:hypothetical protein